MIVFYHPDFTVGIGIAPIQHTLADYYRRSGIAPCPEDLVFNCSQNTTIGIPCQGGGCVVQCIHSCTGAVVSGICAGGTLALVSACIVPLAAVLVMSPPMIWFLYTSRVA